mmetsp:Transcript_17741/g.31006  ORF Transcript_17741/g.31006 Transcript_17741/m.31006 type:complete len:116 (-) Transcript_17741:144-491(-)
MIGTYFSPAHPRGWQINSNDINRTLKLAVITLNLQEKGFDPKRISSHSLRAGGAMAMHLNGEPTHTIQLMGRWSSDTFLTYIHQQLSAFSTNVALNMSNPVSFHNVLRPRVGTIA